MNNDKSYNIVRNALFETGSCSINTWYTIIVNAVPMFEAAVNNKGFIHIRKPYKKTETEGIFMYKKWRFNGKKELIFDGEWMDSKPCSDNFREVSMEIN